MLVSRSNPLFLILDFQILIAECAKLFKNVSVWLLCSLFYDYLTLSIAPISPLPPHRKTSATSRVLLHSPGGDVLTVSALFCGSSTCFLGQSFYVSYFTSYHVPNILHTGWPLYYDSQDLPSYNSIYANEIICNTFIVINSNFSKDLSQHLYASFSNSMTLKLLFLCPRFKSQNG